MRQALYPLDYSASDSPIAVNGKMQVNVLEERWYLPEVNLDTPPFCQCGTPGFKGTLEGRFELGPHRRSCPLPVGHCVGGVIHGLTT